MIGIYKFPDENVSNNVKKSPKFAREYVSAMWSEWDNRLPAISAEYAELRNYAIGEQSIDNCKLAIKRKYIKEEYLSVNWDDRLKLLPQLLRNFYNGVDMSEFSPNVKAIDPFALEIKNTRKNEKLKQFFAKDFLQEAAQANGGQSIIPLDDIPESKEQIKLQEITAKPLKVEQAEELVIDAISRDNLFDMIQDNALKDMVEIGIGVSRVSTDVVEGIKMDYVDPQYFIYDDKNINKFLTKSRYFAKVESITIGMLKNIARENGLEFSDKEIRQMANIPEGQPIQSFATVRVLNYTFRTYFQNVTKKINKKNGSFSLVDRTDDVGTDKEYNPKYSSDKSEKIVDNYDVWFEGIMVLDSDCTILRHRLVKNMPEHKGKIIPPYLVCIPRKVSLVKEVQPIIDSLQELRFRILHHRNTLRGTITEIDPDAISTITLGNEKLTPKEVLSLYFSMSLAFRKSRDEDGELINGSRPLTQIPSDIPYALRELATQFISDLQLLYQAFGAYQYDQVKPDPKTQGENEPFRLSDNTGLRDYTNALFKWSLMNLQSISSRINDAFEWKHIRDRFIDMIGTDDVEVIEFYKKERKDHYFELYVDYIPTKQERVRLALQVDNYVNAQLLTPTEGLEITTTKNLKVALSMLELKLQGKEKQRQEFEMQKIKEAQNTNILTTQVANEEKRKTTQLEYALRAEEKKLIFDQQVFILQKEGEIKIQEAAIHENSKQQLEDFRKKFEADKAAFNKDQDAKLRLKAIDKSAYNQQQLIKLRKGEISDINQDEPKEQVDLSTI